MKVKTAKAAILAQSRKPLIVDEIELPDALDVGQVLVKILYTTICGAQINEIEAAKGPDKFLPHLLGHEASADGDRDRARRHERQAGRHGRAALAAEPGHPVPRRRPTNGAARSSMPAGSRPSTTTPSSRRTG